MPHEVIMPALGMAQDTGRIIAWLKSPGDPVKVGEALMEVETDKATMEVEAGHDGFLTDVRAAAGNDVPVGNVVAMISDSTEGAEKAPPAEADPPAEAAPARAGEHAGKEVIMPALGMAQDTGKIVAWTRALGDKVAADDVLFEVETDKSTMEVPAGHDGWLAEIRAEDGGEVPVGEVIAIISAEAPVAPRRVARTESQASSPAPSPEPTPTPAPKTSDTPAPARAAAAVPQPQTGRILASPKARRLAAERGLDLARLAAEGHPQPFHVSDLETLAALPEAGAATAAPARGVAAAPATAQITGEVPAAALTAFCDWATSDRLETTPLRTVAVFASASLRAATTPTGPVQVGLFRPGAPPETLADPDRAPTAETPAPDAAPDLLLRDLTKSRLTAISLGTAAAPTLTMTRDGETLRLALEFDTGALAPDTAIAFMEGLTARIDDPLRHLL